MDTLTNIDRNVVKIGLAQEKEFKSLKSRINTIESNQVTLSNQLKNIDKKLDSILTILKKNSF
ncbi:hypothetical protein [Flavobacterium panacagri]|uniref:hypothetical protein n=1 Tax=Flavobacterium panacagri TaxID=3034146 RepID=UPI0025A68B6D|nr:hypothetical protein [Flavobacterium panacagri]